MRDVRKISLYCLGLIFLYILVYLLPLNLRPLAIPTETRYAEIPYEMIVSGNWISPRLNDLRYFEKPPLGYWLSAIAITSFGENNFSVRLVSALASGLTAFLIYFFSLKIFPDRRFALLSSFIYLSFLGVYLIGTHSILDSLLTLLITAGIISYVLATLSQQFRQAWFYWAISGISLGLAFLVKGFLAFAIPVLVLVPWLIWQKHWRALLIKGWLVVVIALLVVLPWALAIHQQENDFWRYFFWIEHIQRFTADNAQHNEPIYYFIFYFPVLAFPWIGLLPAMLVGLKDKNEFINQSINRLLWMWVLLPFVFFSLSSGKLATYILPCFPPLAILLSNGLSRYMISDRKHSIVNWGIGFNLLVLGGLLIATIYAQSQDESLKLYRMDESRSETLLLLSVLVALAGGVFSINSKQKYKKLLSVSFCIIPFIVIMNIALPDRVLERRSPESLIRESSLLIDEKTIIISEGSVFRAVNWYLKRQDIYLLDANEVGYGLGYSDASHRLVTRAVVEKMIEKKREQPVAIYCRLGCPDNILDLIPPDATRREYGVFEFLLMK